MNNYDLSILIPARNEEWLSLTIEDIIKNKRGKTEVIVVLDGEWDEPKIKPHEDITVVYLSESIGQRAAQNLACKISKAKYVAKTDAHCAFDEGFDVKMVEAIERAEKEHNTHITIVPVMRNLHIFNWRCKECGMEVYQGPEPKECRNETCAKLDSNDVPTGEPNQFEKVIVWNPKESPQSSAYRFNKELRFKYFPELRSKLPRIGLQETMSLQGSFFMCKREDYWKYELCDESWGSWGQQGSEVALKTWLSGGKVLCNMDTWYAHLFRTQNGFSFPYPMSGKSQQKARDICKELFLEDKWSKQTKPISWLLEKFWFALKDVHDPENKWTKEDIFKLKKEPSKGIIFYTDNQLSLKIAHKVQNQLKKISEEKIIPITSVSLKSMTFGDNYVIEAERGVETYFRQIIKALEKCEADIVYFCEHDVLYHPSHFDFTPSKKDKFYYNTNVWRLKYPEDFAVTWECNQVAELCCYRETALTWYKEKFKQVQAGEFNRSYEPGGRDSKKYEQWRSEEPNIDIRHGANLTKSKWSIRDFRDKSTCVNWQEGECPEWAKFLIK